MVVESRLATMGPIPSCTRLHCVTTSLVAVAPSHCPEHLAPADNPQSFLSSGQPYAELEMEVTAAQESGWDKHRLWSQSLPWAMLSQEGFAG